MLDLKAPVPSEAIDIKILYAERFRASGNTCRPLMKNKVKVAFVMLFFLYKMATG
ncbi:hypothetical protein B4125_2199 [Bacillus paralicheniformis]|uniref:Uncharacterized protein n=1 Tax=Bacillus paralicheniformis TaxID=1648923 RepID=A0A6I7U9J5_9BACI|nr:hypothetical protein SC10_B2orf03946 [Bacillus paralicheniformis]OLF90325.1 hypothetical protein B4121_3600 [Bacillus paralicheniformis]OLG08018.1 hypothetical protein B4125_2199 [Bacillus paralicheniformis]TWJ56752.1 hypothetical protein CHCC5022_2402 [Bacillus paralicheniformis]TWJ74843.1 hypothetical protein CHCC20497_3928 [Bacillus paralicheniformis]